MSRSSFYSSTLSDGLNKVSDTKTVELNRQLCIVKVIIGIIEFLISSTFLSYGIIFLQNVDLGAYTIEYGLWISILYYGSWSLTGPWSRLFCENMDDYGQKLYRYIICTAAMGLFAGITIRGNTYAYGIFSGTFSNLITTQLKYVSIDKFNIHPKIFDCNIHIARAISLLVMPHLVLFFVENYTMTQVMYLYGAFILNVIPAVFLINYKESLPKDVSILSRYHTLTAISTQMHEMKSFTHSGNSSGTMKYNEFEGSDEVEEDLYTDISQMELPGVFKMAHSELSEPVPLTSLTVQTYFSRVGVSILPGIPEEEESEEEDIDVINSKRLSRISTRLERINQNDRKDSIKEVFDINDLISTSNVRSEDQVQNIEFIHNYSEPNFIKEIQQFKRCCCYCTPSRIFAWRRRFRSCKDFAIDNSIRPLLYALKTLYFYPALTSKVSLAILNTIFLTVVPHITIVKNSDFTRADTTFCLAYMAFSWFLFLMLLPLVVTFSGTKVRVTFVVGLLVTGVSMLFITRRRITTNYMILSCLLFGLGYGCVGFMENILYKSFIGARKWSQVEGTLETISACFVILIYYIVTACHIDIMHYLPYVAAVAYFSNAIIWTMMPIVIFIVKYLKGRYSDRFDDLYYN